jgi:hypothetical protein
MSGSASLTVSLVSAPKKRHDKAHQATDSTYKHWDRESHLLFDGEPGDNRLYGFPAMART